jgi:hypothetical protein
MQQDIKDRQAQTQGALQSLADQNTIANNNAANQKTILDNAGAAAQRAADLSDTAWKAQVTAIKDAATAGENALHTSNDAILKNATDTANDTYNTQSAAIALEVKNREEGDARDIHSHELATAANIAGIEQEKTAALAAIDEETRAYAAQEAERVKLIDATLAANVKALNDQLADEKQANTERLAVNAMTKTSGVAAGQELGRFFTATDAQIADSEAALAAKQQGNTKLAAQDTQAAATQQATAQALSDQLSAISQATADQMVTYKLQTDSTVTADNVASLTQQATDQKQALADQLAAEKQTQADKKTATTVFYDGEKAQQTQALADYKWTMAQNLQAFKDTEAQKLASDKTTLDRMLSSIATQQTAENTRHADAIAKINAKAAADTAAIDKLATIRKNDYTTETAQRNLAYTEAQQQRALAYTDAQQKINDTSKNDIDKIQKDQKAADQAFADRTTAADNHFKQQQLDINTTYQSEIDGIAKVQKANTGALAIMTKDTADYATSANGSLSAVLATVNAINAAMGRQAQLQQAAQQASGKGMQTGTGTGSLGGGVGEPLSFAVAGPDGHDRTKGNAAIARAIGMDGSSAYYHDGSTWCESFAEDMTGLPNMGATARDAAANWGTALIPGQTYPGPSLVYFAGPTPAGHVGIADGNQFTSVLDPPWNITTESVGKFLQDNPGASFLGSVPLYAEGGVVPGPWGAPMPAIVHGGEEYLGINGQRGTLAGRAGGGDLHVHVTVQGNVTTERQLVESVRTGLLQLQRSNPTLGFR